MDAVPLMRRPLNRIIEARKCVFKHPGIYTNIH